MGARERGSEMPTALRRCLTAIVLIPLLAGGCGRGGEVLTERHSGRRVADFFVEGDWIVYSWYPAQLISTEGRLVALNAVTGEEVVLGNDTSGSFALGGGRVAWVDTSTRDDERKVEIKVRQLSEQTDKSIAREIVLGLDLAGDHLVWVQKYTRGSDVVLYNLTSGERQTISTGGSTDEVANRDVRIDGGTVAWEAYDWETRSSQLALYDIASGQLSAFKIAEPLPRLEISKGRVVYVERREATAEIHLLDMASGSDSVIASLEGLASSPYLESGKVTWTEYILKEDYRRVPGQPLMDERDFRDIFVYEIDGGGKKKIAGNLLATGGRSKLFGGRVYANIYREPPPPGRSNLTVSVDLLVW